METNFEFLDRLVDNKNSISRYPKNGFKQNLLNLYTETPHTVFEFYILKVDNKNLIARSSKNGFKQNLLNLFKVN